MRGRKWTHEEVSDFFRDQGCKLLTPEYKHSKQKLLYRCDCGAEAFVEFRNFRHKVLKGVNRGCGACTVQKMMETTLKRNGGVHHFQTAEYKERRKQTNIKRYGVENPLQNDAVKAKRRRTCMERYGVPSVSQDPEINRRQQQGFRDKYGATHFMHVPESRKKFQQTLMQRYGVPSLAYLSRCASKESQDLFWEIWKLLPPHLQTKCYFAEHGREFNVSFQGKFFKYDFVQSQARKAIEYNGWNFHPKPHQAPDEVGWCAFHPTLTVKAARTHEALKYEALRQRGFQILTVWDKDRHANPDRMVKECLSFLLT